MDYNTIEDTLLNHNEYMEIENMTDPRKQNAIELERIAMEIIKNPLDQTVLQLLTQGRYDLQVERLAFFENEEAVHHTFDKFINVFVQYFERNPILLRNTDYLYITHGLFAELIFDEDGGVEELIELLLSDHYLEWVDDREEGEQ